MKKGKIIIISGPSGVGKTTVRKRLFEKKELKLAYSISMTTRKKRENEQDKVDYHFVSVDRFKEVINEGRFLEYAQFAENYYGTLEEDVDRLINQGYNVVLEIEIKGAKQILDKRDDVVSLFLMPPNFKELKRRLISRRTDSKRAISKRLNRAKKEIKLANLYNFIIINDDLEDAIVAATKIIEKANLEGE